MNLITPTAELWQQKQGLQGMYDHIERCARVCYRSENKGNITSEEFVKGLIKREHYRPIEFGTIVFKASELHEWLDNNNAIMSPYTKVKDGYLITNLRWLIETTKDYTDSYEDILAEWSIWNVDVNQYRPTIHWHISRGIADEFRTHVSLSSLMESTRYVNYNRVGANGLKDLNNKNNHIDFIIPSWYNPNALNSHEIETAFGNLENTFAYCERAYSNMIDKGFKPQQAREVLPLATATHLVQCGFNKAWNNFFNQRCSPSAHPDSQYISKQAKELFATIKFNEIQNN